MYTGHTVPWRIILRLAWKPIIFFIIYGFTAVAAYKLLDFKFLQLPLAPASAIAVAVAFYVGLKNSSAYDRLWEARTVWGNLINASREWGVQIMHLVGPYSRIVQATADNPAPDHTEAEKAELLSKQRRLILRHIAFLNAARFQLRSKTWWKEEMMEVREGQKIAEQEGDADNRETMLKAISPFLSEEEALSYKGSGNVAVDILNRQSAEIRDLWAERWIDTFHHVELLALIGASFNGLGASERLNSFPFPRQYATFSRVFIWLFVLVLPFMLIGEVSKDFPDGIWMVVPLYVIIAWVFTMMEVVGGSSENPFENAMNDVPISALCRIAEIDLKKMLGDKDLPEAPKPVHDILM